MSGRRSAKAVGDARLKAATSRRRAPQESDALAPLINAAVGLKFGPTESALNKAIGQNNLAPGALDRAFGHYRDTIDAARTSVNDAYDKASGYGQQATNLAAGAVAAAGAGMAQGATPQGAIDQSKVAGDFAQKLAAVNAAYGVNRGAAIEAGRTQAIGSLGTSAIEGQQRYSSELGKVLERGQTLQDQMAALAGQKGDFAIDFSRQLDQDQFNRDIAAETLNMKKTQSLRDYTLGKLKLTQDGRQFDARLGFDKQKLSVTDANADADRQVRLDDLDARIKNWQTQAGQRNRDLDIKELTARGGPAGAGLSSAQQSAWSQKKAKIQALSKAFNTEMSTGHYKNTGEVFTALRRRFGFSRQELEMARDLAVLHYLGDRGTAAAAGYFPGGHIPEGFSSRDPAKSKGK